jgi:hypothetical protein
MQCDHEDNWLRLEGLGRECRAKSEGLKKWSIQTVFVKTFVRSPILNMQKDELLSHETSRSVDPKLPSCSHPFE